MSGMLFMIGASQPTVPRGVKKGRPFERLSEEQAIAIYTYRDCGFEYAALLGRRFGVTERTVQNIWNGRTWSDVTGGFPVRRMGRPPGVKDSKPRVSREAKRERLCAGRIDDQLFEWARTRFVLARLFKNDEIDNLE
jgi:hypothetical protein